MDQFSAVGVAAAASFGLSQQAIYMLWCGIGIYLLAMLAIGFWSSRRIKKMSDFLVAGRRLPLWMATATLLATWFGAGSSMGVAAKVYSDGVPAVIADPFAASVSLLIAGVFIVGMLRKAGCMTVTDIIERKYGRGCGAYASLWMLSVYIGWLGAQLRGIGIILNVLTGLDTNLGTLIGTAVVVIYTFAGGMWAVTLTDIVQVTLIIFGLILLVPGAVDMAGGREVLINSISTADISLAPPTGGNFNDLVFYIGSWIIMGLGCSVGQDLVQRSLSSKTGGIAVASSVMSGFFYLMIGLIPITIGFAARLVLPQYGITAEMMTAAGGELDDQVLPRMAMVVLGNMHPILLTFFLSALIAAIMSSADSSLLAGSSLLCKNVIGALWPQIKEKHLLLSTRLSTLLLTVVGLFFAIRVESIYKLMINSWASQLVIVFVPVVTALYIRGAGKAAGWATMLVSTVVWIGYTFIFSAGSGMEFVELMNSPEFERNLTCGAVYGFASGVLTFLFCLAGEKLTAAMVSGEENGE